MKDESIHVPASLDCGKMTTKASSTEVAGVNEARPLFFADPEGLSNTASTAFTPEKSSAAENFTRSTTGPLVVSIVSGSNSNRFSTGGTVSGADLTSTPPRQPDADNVSASRVVVF